MNPLISIVVPCYNQAQYLDECLQSVLEQTYENWECIIVNDGSPDSTHEVAQEWLEKDTRFKYIQKENGGLSSARNAGLDAAVGAYIQFLDCDDLIQNQKFEQKIKIFKDYGEVEVLISGYRYFLDNSTDLRIQGNNGFYPEVFIDRLDSSTEVLNLILRKNPFVVSAPLYKKDVFDKIGNFDEKFRSLEDWDFNLRAAIHEIKFHHIGYLPNTKTLIRLHENSMMRNIKVMEEANDFFIKKKKLYQKQFPNLDLNLKLINKANNFKFKLQLFIPPILYKIKNRILNGNFN